MAATHEGVFLSYWVQDIGPEGQYNRLAIGDFLISEGSGYQDITGTPSANLYNPAPNACVVRAFGTLAELTAVSNDPDHFEYWIDVIPQGVV